jgi:glycosyltransferase XagB
MSVKTPTARRIGDVLVESGLLTAEQLTEALDLSRRWGVFLGEAVMAKGWVKPLDFYGALSRHLGIRFVNLVESPSDASLLKFMDIPAYNRLLLVPWRKDQGRVVVATANPGPETDAFVRKRFGEAATTVLTSRFDIVWSIQGQMNPALSRESVNSLYEKHRGFSAREVFSRPQLVTLLAIASMFLLLLSTQPLVTLLALNAFVAVFYLGNLVLRMLLAWLGSSARSEATVSRKALAALHDSELPVYSVLVPLFREPAVVPHLVAALRRLDYPKPKLDIKLILEENDEETLRAIRESALEPGFEIIRVPYSLPQTKPKACNYGLYFARGEFVTLFDAEDRPDPDQLKKALITFRRSDDRLACVQARLNYFNANENWLSRLFTLEYSTWFDLLLPGLERLRIPIPLGGTSNHFRTGTLREIGAWDPFNVTEDADLGVRLNQEGYRSEIINSTTFEEAVTRPGTWLRQRTRWIKGYMQTYLVHMRNPVGLLRSLGLVGFLGFQLFIGGTVLTLLLNPLLWLIFLGWALELWVGAGPLFPPFVAAVSLINLIIGNAAFMYLSMVGVIKRRNYELIPYALLSPAYWLMMSIAAYRALWQLIHNPHFWEKTDHGTSRAFREPAAHAPQIP